MGLHVQCSLHTVHGATDLDLTRKGSTVAGDDSESRRGLAGRENSMGKKHSEVGPFKCRIRVGCVSVSIWREGF